MDAANNTKLMKLTDGRTLCFSEYGNTSGKPVIYFHGFLGSRLEVQRFDQIVKANNYRLIAVDRPGMGLSSLDTNRSILSTIDDIVSLANYLKLDKFSVLGHSGGGIFVAACAYAISHRLNAAAIVSGMAPFTNSASHVGMMRAQLISCKLIKRFPFLATPMMRINKMMLNKSDKLLEKMIKPLPDVDKEIFRDPVGGKEVINSSLESFRMGVAGPAYEMKLILNPWGFRLEDISFPVTIWHGGLDTQARIVHGKIYAQSIPNSTLKIFENDGHHSLIKNHFEQIINSL